MRQHFAKAVLFTCAALLSSAHAQANDAKSYPDHPIKVIVGFVPGGPTDLYARIAAHALSDTLGQQVVVENKAGASGVIAAAAVAAAPPDGYTLLVNVVSDIITPLYRNTGYNLERNFAPIGLIASAPNVLVVNPDLHVNSLKELIDYARKNPNTVTFGSAGTGTVSHLAGALLASETGTKMTHIPYKGTNGAQMDLMAGRISMMFDNLTNGLANAKAGKVKALAITSPQRWNNVPDVPTMAESGFPGVTIMSIFGLVAPAGTPAPVVAKLSDALTKGLKNEEYRKSIIQSGAEPGAMTPKEYGKYISDESRRWEKFLEKNPGIMKG